MATGARGSGDLLSDLKVLALDAEVATLAAGWWLAELGADVRGPSLAGAPGDDVLTPFLGRRITPVEAGLFTYAIGVARDGHVPDHGGRLAPGGTLLQVTGPPVSAELGPRWVDVVAWARSGMADLTRAAFPRELPAPPRIPADAHASMLAGTVVAIAVCSVEIGARAGRPRPASVAVDRQEVLAALPQQPVAAAQVDRCASPDRPAFPGGVHEAADGLVFVQPFEPAQWHRLLGRVELAGGLALSAPPTFAELSAHREAIAEAISAWVAHRTVMAVVDELQGDHVPAAPISEPGAVLTGHHLRARGFCGPDGPTVPWVRTVGEPGAVPPEREARRRLRPPTDLPLDGLRVLDLTWAWAGPFATTVLADLGAEVINVEWWPRPSNLRPQPPSVRAGSPNGGGWWSANQRGKASIGVNLKTPGGVAVVRELAAISDVAIENFSPGVVDRLGVGFADLVRSNPGLVYVSMSAFGATGPAAHWVGYGTQLLAASGMARATLPDDGAVALTGIPYPDPVSGLAGALAVVAAAGRGAAHLDVSEIEATCHPIFETLLRGGHGRAPASAPWHVVSGADGRPVVVTPASAEGQATGATAEEIVTAVRAAGGDAAVIASPGELLDDERLRARGFWRPDRAPELGAHGVEVGGPVTVIDGHRPDWWRGAPDLFQDTERVLTVVLGYGRDQLDGLLAEGAIGVPPQVPEIGGAEPQATRR